ncbi:MAG TPA: hypothetical protein PLF13_12210 [candidate division Zixibacteria bacterium]|mgnify:CR=1 FL=1|nr:hypothetical protein [candidate division Zixibacteria bacterium]
MKDKRGRAVLISLSQLLLAFGCSDSEKGLFDMITDAGDGIGSSWADSAYIVSIESVEEATQGAVCSVSVTITPAQVSPSFVTGFRLLVGFDPACLCLMTVQPGEFLVDCDWEQFSYAQGVSTDCGPEPCPSGVVHMTGYVGVNDGDGDPLCLIEDWENEVELARLYFLVSDDRTLECTFVPIRFIWYDCNDNLLSTASDTVMFSRYLWDYQDSIREPSTSLHEYDGIFPSYLGALEDCINAAENPRVTIEPIRWIDFVNGGVDINCADSVDIRE